MNATKTSFSFFTNMNKIFISIIIICLLSPSIVISINAFEIETDVSEELESILINNEAPFDGYTLLNPWLSKNTYLINNTGEVVHSWKSDHFVSFPAYLLENGNLIRSSPVISDTFLLQNGCGGRVEMFDWDGNLIWDFTYEFDTYILHNDIEPLPNGNILMSAWELKTFDEAVAAGVDPNLFLLVGNRLLSDYIIEIEPIFPSGGNIVWEWHVWDHLIQDYDSSKENYGVVANHPELLDINYDGRIFDVTHVNSIYYNETFDQLLISLRHVSEIWVIDHSTTTVEAVGHTGGNYGKGGDILYRWGNPQIYDGGDENDQKLFMQHDARWIEQGCPGEGHITIFNNGVGRPGELYSSVEEIIPPMDNLGNYYLKTGFTYGPDEAVWSYSTDMYSHFISGAQRLPNGNTFVCCGVQGHLLEINPANEVVWEYINPYPVPIPMYNSIFKTQCYPKDYPGIGSLLANINSVTLELGNTATTSTSAITITQNNQQSSTSPVSQTLKVVKTTIIPSFFF